MQITLEETYWQVLSAVKYYPPQATPCLRPNTFRVLAYDADIHTDTAGIVPCDANKPYAYSRDWVANQLNPNEISAPLPIVTLFQTNGSLKDPFQKNSKQTAILTLAVWDKLDQNKTTDGCEGCEKRTPHEIFRDTEIILRNILYYLNGVIQATTNVDLTPHLYHKDLLPAMVTAGTIASFTPTGQILLNSLASANPNAPLNVATRVAEYLFGTFIELNFARETCSTVEFDFTTLDYGLLSMEANCRNCD